MKNIDANKLIEMLVGGGRFLEINKSYVDSLNVFPVPDGDTGTNMSLTMATAVREISQLTSSSIDDIILAFSRGALKGARGNSGVILSQIFKGMAKIFAEEKEITSKAFSRALISATEVAYAAVTKPKEGTILTVVRYMAEQSHSIATRNSSLLTFLDAVIRKGDEILAKTPDMLPVLKKAGVVDAGGKGLLCVFQGFYNVLANIEMDAIEITEIAEPMDTFAGDIHDLGEIKYAYCTEYFVVNLNKQTTEEDIEKLRDKLMTIGDSVITIGDLSMVKVHVHTNDPNKALGYALKLGELDKIKIENMLEQNRELIKKREANKKPMGIISICTGTGMASLFRELQVDKVIEGGQTMNPSVEDILHEIERMNTDNVIVLPNNKNIILAAEQARELTSKKVQVLQTVNIPQGISACVVYNPVASMDVNCEAMSEAFEQIRYGEVTYAVRTTKLDGFDLKEGDIIGLTSKKIVAKSDSVEDVTKTVIEKLVDEDMAVITLYYGEGVSEDQAQAFAESVQAMYPDYEVVALEGGQHHYYYMISVE